MTVSSQEAGVILPNRRTFIGLAGTALIASRLSWSREKTMASLDHLLFGCNDLDTGIAFVEQHTGVRAAVGGVHPGRGTRNALLSLGERQYLEIIAPDPNQKNVDDYLLGKITRLDSPRLVAWAAHVDDIDAFARRLTASGVKIEAPQPGSRQRPDGRILEWKTLGLQDDMGGLLPFFIEWSRDSVHPSVDAPHGCRLESFVIEDKDPRALSQLFAQLELAAKVKRGDRARLMAHVRGPQGNLELTS